MHQTLLATEHRRQRLERMLPMMRLGCFAGILGWFVLGYWFDAPGLYALALAVTCMLVSIYAYGFLIQLRGITPEIGAVVVGLTVSIGAASTGYFAPWAVGGLVCVVTFGGLFAIAFTERRMHAGLACITVLLGLACLTGGMLAPSTEQVPGGARIAIVLLCALVGIGLVLFAQMEALADEHRAKAVLERSNAALAERERQLMRISQSPALEEGDLAAACSLVTSAAQAALGVQRASVWLFDEAAQGMALTLLRDGDTESTGPLVLPYASYPRYFAALKQNRVLLAHDARRDVATSEFTEGYLTPLNIFSMLDAGIHFGGRSVGVLCCEHTGAVRQWTEQEGFFTGALADTLTRALAAAEKRKADEALRELNASLEARVAERTAAAEEAQRLAQERTDKIEAVQDRLRRITDASPGALYQLHRAPEGRYRFGFMSAGIEDLIGVDWRTATQNAEAVFATTHPDDTPGLVAKMEESARALTPFSHVFRVPRPGAGMRWLQASSRPSRDADGGVTWDGFLADVTEERQQAQLVALAQQRLLNITDSIAGLVYEYRRYPDGRHEAPFISSGVQQLLGVSQQAVLDHVDRFFELVLPEDLPGYSEDIQRSAEQGVDHRYLFRIRHAVSGETRWMLTSARAPQRDERGTLIWRGYVIDITDQKLLEAEIGEARDQAEAARRAAVEARQRLVEITDKVPGVVYEIVIHPAGSVSFPFISRMLDEMFGVTATEVMADPQKFFANIHPDDAAALYAEMMATAVELRLFEFVVRYIDPRTGKVLSALARAQPTRQPDGSALFRGVMADITEQKALEAELQETRDVAEASRRRISEMADNVPGVVYRCRMDADWTMLFISSGITLLTGYPVSDFIHNAVRSYASVIHPEDTTLVDRVVGDAVAQHKAYSVEYRVVTQSGAPRWVLERGRASYNDRGLPDYLDGSITDISEQKQLQIELLAARDLAAEASRAKSEFLANMSHEIRTPMNAIIGLSHLALKTQLNTRQHDYLNKIHNSAQSLLGIINDILDLSKIEAGKLGIENTEFDLLEVLDNLASLVSVKAEEKGLEFLISTAPGLPYFLVGDPLRLGQVLLNLAGNAVKFTGEGQVMVSVTELPGSRTRQQIGLRFAITDTGIGLSEEQRSKLFKAFSQADASTTRKYGGTGLGLTISKQLAELMGGEIGVDSVAGEGSTFWFTITAGIATERRRAGRGSAEALQGRRVLVVDDNPSARNIVENYVTSFGMRPTQASNGEQSVRMVQEAQAAGAPYDLVLMDWQMPGLNGIEAAQKIRQLDAPPKIVLLTAHGREEVIKSAEDAQLDGFLVKPVNPSLLLDASLVALFGGSLAGSGRRRDRADDTANVLSGLNVLLAEDNEINQQVAREVLEGFGVKVTIAENGRLAYEALRQAKTPFHAVLMDMQMPEMDGLTATRTIRADASIAHLPIIAMTANAMEADRQACVDAGMDDFISKPFKPKELLRLLQKWGWGESTALPVDAPDDSAGREPQMFNVADGVDRVGSEAVLVKLAKQLFEQPQAAVATIPALVEGGDHEAAIRAAHSAAGASSLLGFEQLAAAAKALEAQLKQRAPFAEALRAVQQAFAEAEAALAGVAAPAAKAGASTLDAATRDQWLNTLAAQIDSYDSQATETIAALRDALGSAAPTLLEQIDEHLNNFAFDDAAGLMPALLEALSPNPSE